MLNLFYNIVHLDPNIRRIQLKLVNILRIYNKKNINENINYYYIFISCLSLLLYLNENSESQRTDHIRGLNEVIAGKCTAWLGLIILAKEVRLITKSHARIVMVIVVRIHGVWMHDRAEVVGVSPIGVIVR